MSISDLRDNTFAVIDASNYVINIVYLTSGSWIQPADTTLVQLYEYERCNVGDYYNALGSPPNGRFAYVTVDPDFPTYESTLEKPHTRFTSGGSDSGSLYVENSLIIGEGNSGGYIQFADGTRKYSAIIDGGIF